MTKSVIKIISPGLLSTIQDLGRYGFQHLGIPESGAMDKFALRVGNSLLGNPENRAAIEITGIGPSLIFLENIEIAITGANLSPKINGSTIPQWQNILISKNDHLTFEDAIDGFRSYICIKGGIDCPNVLGSKSTFLKGQFGGIEGRSLKENDIILANADRNNILPSKKLPPEYTNPIYGNHHILRIILGPQNNHFTDNALSTLVESQYKITLESDRVGYRLEGPELEHIDKPDILSDGSPPGAIQIPGNGQPTILMADRGTTGGYAKIGTIISTDISQIAQASPGQIITFQIVNQEEASALRQAQEQIFIDLDNNYPITKSNKQNLLHITDNKSKLSAFTKKGLPLTSNTQQPQSSQKLFRTTVTSKKTTYTFDLDVNEFE